MSTQKSMAFYQYSPFGLVGGREAEGEDGDLEELGIEDSPIGTRGWQLQ